MYIKVPESLSVCCRQAINFLRYNCLPVGVVDGVKPAEKRECLRRR